MNPYLWLAGLVFLGLACAGSFRVGMKYERTDWLAKENAQQVVVITHERTLREKVPEIVTRTVTKEVIVEREVPRVIEVIRREIPPDCVLPPDVVRVLVDSARAFDGDTPGGVDEASRTDGCRQVIEAVVKDLGAGKRNSARLTGLQEWARAVSQ